MAYAATAAQFAEAFIGGTALALEAAAAAVILIAAIRAFFHFLRHLLPRHGETRAERHDIRHRFGRSLVLGLDFAIGSDILKVAIDPTFQAVAVAGLVVVVRSLLTLVLELELRSVEAEPS